MTKCVETPNAEPIEVCGEWLRPIRSEYTEDDNGNPVSFRVEWELIEVPKPAGSDGVIQ